MERRETQTKAKAFAFVLDQLAWIGDDLLVDANGGRVPGGYRPAKLAYWSWLLPQIGTDPAKRSRWQANMRPEELLRNVARPGVMSEGLRGTRLRPDALASFDLACILGWLVRSEDGPFEELLTSERHFPERLGRNAIATYMALLNEDFAGLQPYLFDGLQDAITATLLGVLRAPEGRVCSWRFGFDQFGSYLVRKHRMGGCKQDWRADLVTLLIMASLLGPNDYRADLLVSVPEKFEDTIDPDARRSATPARDAVRHLDVPRRAFLTRVTFDRDPPDELDWIACEGDVDATGQGVGRLLAVPLANKRKVVMARGLPRFGDAGDVVEIPLNCREASSREHLVLELDGDAWTVRDVGSSNGTLVVSRDGTRRLLYRKVAGGDRPVRLRNGDVICVAPDHRTGRAVSSNPAYLFHEVASAW